MRSTLVRTLLLTLALLFVPATAASPDHDAGAEDTYGAYPGDPRVVADAGPCTDATADLPGTSCTVLYGHVFNLLDKILANTQRVPDYWYDIASGFRPNGGHEYMWELNDLTLISSPGFVEYSGPDVQPLIHAEVGITKDVEIDPSVPLTGYWYLSADYDDGFGHDDVAGEGPDAGVLPCLTVRMTLQTGRHWGVGDALAVGETTKTVISAKAAGDGEASAVPPTPCPGDRTAEPIAPEAVTEFQVTLEPLAETLKIPADKGFIVHVEWYQWAPTSPENDDKLYQYQWNLRTGPEHLNRVVLPTKTNVWIEEVKAVPFDGRLFVQGIANSPFGSYDIDPDSLAIRLLDEDGQEVALDHVGEPLLRYSTGHDGHFLPMAATFPWDHKAEALDPGTYTIELSARNWQHLAEARGTTTVVIQDGDKEPLVGPPTTPPAPPVEEAPSLAAIPVLLGLLAAARVCGRRRS